MAKRGQQQIGELFFKDVHHTQLVGPGGLALPLHKIKKDINDLT